MTKTSNVNFDDFTKLGSPSAESTDGRAEPITIGKRTIRRHNFSPKDVNDLISQGVVIELTPSWKDEIPLLALLAVAVALILISVPTVPPTYAPFPVRLFIPLSILGAILHRLFNSRYYISDKELTVMRGYLSLRLIKVSTPFDKIKLFDVEKNIFQRLFGIGTIYGNTYTNDEASIRLRGIDNPHFFEKLLKMRVERKPTEGNVHVPNARSAAN